MLDGLTQTGDSVKMGMSRNSDGRSSCCTHASLDSAPRRLVRCFHVREAAGPLFSYETWSDRVSGLERLDVRRSSFSRPLRHEPVYRIYRGFRSMSFSPNVKIQPKCLLRDIMKLTMMHKFPVSPSQVWLCGVALLQVNSQALFHLSPVANHIQEWLWSHATGLCSHAI
jgi:hypothetical protein